MQKNNEIDMNFLLMVIGVILGIIFGCLLGWILFIRQSPIKLDASNGLQFVLKTISDSRKV